MSDVSPVVEIRMPTYQRPQMLRRALDSLLQQTHKNWRCIVLDDSPNGEAGAVVASLSDDRIVHKKNPKNLGAASNINQAFVSHPLAGGEYFFVLEDDNYLLPRHIESGVKLLLLSRCSVGHLCQLIEAPKFPDDLNGALSDEGIITRVFSEKVYEPHIFRLASLFGMGISNGGLFWHRSARSVFWVDFPLNDAVLHEHLRAFQLVDAIAVSTEPTAVWRLNGDFTLRGTGAIEHNFLSGARSLQLLAQAAFDQSGLNTNPALVEKFDRACHLRMEEGTYRALRKWPGRSVLSRRRKLELRLKANALRLVRPPDGLPEAIHAARTGGTDG